MSRRAPRPRNALNLTRSLVTLVAVIAVAAGTVFPSTGALAVGAQSSPTTVASGSIAKTSLAGFKPGNIISDAVFTNKNTMTEAQISAFIDSKVSKCDTWRDKNGPYICLEEFRITSVDRPADKYCTGYKGAANESAARIIYKSAQACGLNPQVLLVMLEKEQSLITHTWPSAWRYDKALGQGCPDGGVPCNPAYVGFFHQIYGAARQMQMYMEGRYFTWYPVGKTSNILYHPNRACGTSPVFIENKATSALYYYTPYQPNAAALRAYPGTGDSCSSYGNRNFYALFTKWFGSTQVNEFTMGTVYVTGEFKVGQAVRASAAVNPAPTSVAFQWFRNDMAIPGASAQSYSLTAADAGTSVHVRATAKRAGFQDGVANSAKTTVKGVTVDRYSGRTREQTAVAVSRTAFPSGAATVMLATSLDFADALSAAAASGKASASLLLTPAAALHPDAAAEIKRLAPQRVVLVGGSGVLSDKVAQQVADAVPTAKVERLAGKNRYETSRMAAQLGGQSQPQILIATGRDYPDALSAASAGNGTGSPVLLVNGVATRLDDATVATIRKVGARSATIVGGDGAVTPGIQRHLAELGLTVSRLSGGNRYETNDAVAKKYYPAGTLKTVFASGVGFADALPASVLAGRWKIPLLLTAPTCVVPTAVAYMRTGGTESVVLVGGPAVLDAQVEALRPC